jgi:Holliday junction resolvase RusA-like endonuclease
MVKARFTLAALPPSVNHLYRHTRGGKVYRTSDYMTWLNGEGWNLKAQLPGQHKFTGPVYLTLAMRRPRATSDIDNRQKGIFDLLQSVGAIDNDKNIMGVNAWWSDRLPPGVAAEVSITEADELEAA